MKLVSFTKMVASGNDFVLIKREENTNIKFTKETIRKICDRKFGVGADGLMILYSDLPDEPNVEFYNSDGSYGALCGNGSRCIIYLMNESRKSNEPLNFFFNGKEYSGYINPDGFPVFNLQPPVKIQRNLEIDINGSAITGDFIDLNVPHFVVDIIENLNSFPDNHLESIDVINLGKKIRFASSFAPVGVNVNFIKVIDGEISIRTYERGVEGETLSCGTGSVSAALSAFLNGKVKPPVKLFTKSGENLEVDFIYENNIFTNLTLTGSAKIVFNGKFILN